MHLVANAIMMSRLNFTAIDLQLFKIQDYVNLIFWGHSVDVT